MFLNSSVPSIKLKTYPIPSICAESVEPDVGIRCGEYLFLVSFFSLQNPLVRVADPDLKFFTFFTGCRSYHRFKKIIFTNGRCKTVGMFVNFQFIQVEN